MQFERLTLGYVMGKSQKPTGARMSCQEIELTAQDRREIIHSFFFFFFFFGFVADVFLLFLGVFAWSILVAAAVAAVATVQTGCSLQPRLRQPARSNKVLYFLGRIIFCRAI